MSSDVKSLMDMGIAKEQAQQALKLNGYNRERALDYIFGGGMQEENTMGDRAAAEYVIPPSLRSCIILVAGTRGLLVFSASFLVLVLTSSTAMGRQSECGVMHRRPLKLTPCMPTGCTGHGVTISMSPQAQWA